MKPKRLRIVGGNYAHARIYIDDMDIPAIAHVSAHAGDVDIVMPAIAKLVAQLADLNRQIKEASEQLRLLQDSHEQPD